MRAERKPKPEQKKSAHDNDWIHICRDRKKEERNVPFKTFGNFHLHFFQYVCCRQDILSSTRKLVSIFFLLHFPLSIPLSFKQFPSHSLYLPLVLLSTKYPAHKRKKAISNQIRKTFE